MADLAVTERRIRPIQDAAAAKNWKQALQLCDKWQKKGENSDRFLALKASVLVNQPDKAQAEKGRQETLKLCSRSNPVTDIEALFQLQSSLKHLSLQHVEGPRLWERAVAAVPRDKSLMTTWLNGALADSNWLMAQKAAMALRKSFPKERQYEFWNILFCYLAHKDTSLSVKERMLFGTLAYRLVSKAADTIPKDNSEVLSPGNAITTTEELALLLQIHLSTSHHPEALALLQSETAGLRSKIAEHDVTMVFSLLLQALNASDSSIDTLGICQSLLDDEDSPIKDLVEDDRIWKVIIEAGNTGDSEKRQRSLSLIEAVLKNRPACRAAHLAKLSILRHSVVSKDHSHDDLFSTCRQYLNHFGTKPFCFEDLCTPLRQLDPKYIQDLIEETSTENATSTEKLLALKMKYALLGRNELQTEGTLEFSSQAIRLLKSLPEAGNERPEAALLAALALLRLAAEIHSVDLILQACLIMESLYSRYVEYYPLAVRLLQVYRSIGLMSLATSKFIALSIKNMQWETVGHLLLTRASTLHPISSGHDENSLNPLYALDTALEMLDNMEQSLDNAIQKGLGFGSYANVLDTVKLRSDVQQSLNRQVYMIEERRIQNLVGIPVDSILQPLKLPLVDTRDFTFLNNYGIFDGALESFLAGGSLPGQTWLDTMSFIDHLRQYLRFELIGQNALARTTFEALTSSYEKFDGHGNDALRDLTSAESTCLQCWFSIYQLIACLHSPDSNHTKIDLEVDRIIAWIKESSTAEGRILGGIVLPDWQYLHTSFSVLDVLQTVNLVSEFLSRREKLSKGKSAVASKEKIIKLQTYVSEAAAAVCQSAKNLKDGINSSGVLSQLIDAAAGRLGLGPLSQSSQYRELAKECEDLYDEVFLEEHCGSMKNSWDDALSGLLAVKIRI